MRRPNRRPPGARDAALRGAAFALVTALAPLAACDGSQGVAAIDAPEARGAIDADVPTAEPTGPCVPTTVDAAPAAADDDAHAALANDTPSERATLVDPCAAAHAPTPPATYGDPTTSPTPPPDSDANATAEPTARTVTIAAPSPAAPPLWNGRGRRPTPSTATSAAR